MDIVWLILDSLSYADTSFVADGPDTTPQLRSLADDAGIVYHNAYAPGPLSPSSHASFFTGTLPSEHGMHAGYPFFTAEMPTIADALAETHRTHLFSVNNFLFTGLEAGFDEAENFTNTYLLFDDATDPRDFFRTTDHDSRLARYLDFAFNDGKPVRSILNGLNFKYQTSVRGQEYLDDIPKHLGDDDGNYQYANLINRRIRTALSASEPSFVVANYMDIHPPLAPSDEAIAAVAPDWSRDELPIGKPTERTIPNEQKSFDTDAMYALYHAGAWELDRKLAPLVRDLIDDGVFVAITADHGATFWNQPLSEVRRHVPLVLFHPEEEPRSVDRTVDLRALPNTTLEVAGLEASLGDCSSLLSSSAGDETAITEVIYNDTGDDGAGLLVDHSGSVSPSLTHDIALKKGEAELVVTEGEIGVPSRSEPEEDVAELQRIADRLRNRDLSGGTDAAVEYDQEIESRLEDLGYM